MRKLMLLVAVILAFAPVLAAPDLPVLDPSRVTEKTLPNGLKLVVKEERQWPVVALGAYIRAGSRHERPAEVVAAHLVEHLLFEATGDDAQKLAPFIEAMGGRIAAMTMRDFVHVDLIIASRYLERVLPVFVRAVFEAGFTDQQMMRELSVVKREIADRRDRADLYLDEMIWRLAYDKHPYGHPIGGTVADLDKLTYDTVNQFYRRFYVPNNVSFVAVGDVDPAWLEGRLKELTAQIPAREMTWREPPLDPSLTQTRVKAEPVGREISLLAFAWRAAAIDDPTSVCALDLIYTLLGQEGAGRLNTRLVHEQKVLLSSEVGFLTQKQPGLFIITALVQPGREEEAQAAIVKEVLGLATDPISDQELTRAKRLLYAEYAFTNESYDDQVGSMGFYASISSYRFALDYIDLVMKITPEQIQQVARQLLRADSYSLAILRGQKGGRPETAAMLP
jgi:zinc protease